METIDMERLFKKWQEKRDGFDDDWEAFVDWMDFEIDLMEEA